MLLGHCTWVSALSKPLGAADQVVPPSACVLIRPPSPTSTHAVPLVQAIDGMSLLDGTHVAPPSAVLKNVLTAPQEPPCSNFAVPRRGAEAAPTA